MPEIKAIETEYNGYKFRSRLEARWAVFFDALGVKYEYEPEGYETKDGTRYLPDFKIKCYGKRGSYGNEPFDLYIEVKGVMTQADADKIWKFCGEEKECELGTWTDIVNPVLIVGQIPNPDTYSSESSDMDNYKEMDGIRMYPWNYQTIDGDYFACYPAVKDGHFYLDGDDSNYITMDSNIIADAFRKARHARFEFGETPTV